MQRSFAQQQALSDSSLSDDQEELRKIKEKLLMKEKKKIDQENQRKAKQRRQKTQSSNLRATSQENFSYRRIDSRRNNSQRSRSRSRQKLIEQKQIIRWHIYQDIGKLDYRDTLDEKLRNLPIFKKKDQILQKILKNQIVLVTGDTGCGKSTQVPRMIYEYLKLIGSNDKIICVQPRRLAVTSLKSSVRSQIKQGDGKNLIGYQIGQKAQFSEQSKIVFMTNGIFLQRIVHDTSFLQKYPFIVLDQVHERDIDTDFILTALKRIIRKYNKVRIILMSATIDNELFRFYFASDQIDKFMTEQNFYKQILYLQNHEKWKHKQNYQQIGHIDQQSDQQQKTKQLIYNKIAFQFMKSKFPCPTININQPSNHKRTYFYLDTMSEFMGTDEYLKKWGSIIFDKKYPNAHKQLYEMAYLILRRIKQNNQRNYKRQNLAGEAVLIFLPGLNQIECLTQEIIKLNGGQQKTYKDFEIIHVHSTIMTQFVQRDINTPNHKQIKVIIATNIAQSSITVKGVKYIIDFCLTKQIRYDMKSRMQSLQLVWSSKASCKQRAGRTGRVCDGFIFKLVEKKFFDQQFNDYSEPEIKRSSLDKLILRIKMMHQHDKFGLFRDPAQVLGTCIQPPQLESIQSAISSLKFCGGLSQQSDQLQITKLGRLYVQIPIDITYTKLLLISTLFGTYYDILILVSILSQTKNPIRKKEMQKNYSKYFQEISNYQYCDFISLINMYKAEDSYQQLSRQQKLSKKDRLAFALYKETKNTMQDIQRRIVKKKQWIDFDQLDQYFRPRNQSEHSLQSKKLICKDEQIQYFQRFKLTLAFAFIDKLILIKQPCYQIKQQKRIKDMKKSGIQNNKTIVLLNSKQITKPTGNNIQAQYKLIDKWKLIFKKSMNINVKNITLTTGLNYLHFQTELDLYKLLFTKYMSSRKLSVGCILDKQNGQNQRGYKENHRSSYIIPPKQILERIGDLDYMQQGVPVTLFKQQNITIDHFSLNRVSDYNQHENQKYLMSNVFMLQNQHSLSCRYTSLLNLTPTYSSQVSNNNILHVLVNLIFYPFLKLKPDTNNSYYEFLSLKKKYKIKIPYNLQSNEIQQANFIRMLIKQFMELQLPINQQTCSQFYDLVKKFIFKRRKNVIHQKQQLLWQQQFIKQNQTYINQHFKRQNTSNVQKNKQNFLLDKKNNLNENQNQKDKVNKNQQNRLKQNQKSVQNCMQTIVQQKDQHKKNKKQQAGEYINLLQLKKNGLYKKVDYENKNFMNPIELGQTSSSGAYFLRSPAQQSQLFEKRINKYLEWKLSKMQQIQTLTEYAQNNESYLCCKQCGISNPICRLKRIGPLDDQQIFRDLFQPMNVKQSVNASESTDIDIHLSQQNFQSEYKKITCKNNHEIGIRIGTEQKVKILIFFSYMIKYPDNKTQEVDIFNIDPKYWSAKQRQSIINKQKTLLSTSCFLCSDSKIQTLKQLKIHMKDNYHIQKVEKFKKSIQSTKNQLNRNFKKQQDEIEIQDQNQEKNKKQYFEKLVQKKESKQNDEKNKSKEVNNNQIEVQFDY